MPDEATYKADKGWGGDQDFLAPETYDISYPEMADDEILKKQLAEDSMYDDKTDDVRIVEVKGVTDSDDW